MMKLKVLIPETVFLEKEVDKVVAEAANGSFALLPRHVDFVAPLVPGILTCAVGEDEEFLAVDRGILVKVGDEVLVSVQRAVRGPNLESLQQTVRDHFRKLNEEEEAVRHALDRLEADVMRRFVELHQEARQ